MSNQELIPLKPLDEAEIASHNPHELWFLSIHDEEMGPFHQTEVQSFAASHAEILKDIKVKKYQTEEWKSFFDEATFQRRKPQLISSTAFVSQDNFLVLINGVKKGPYTGDKVRSMLQNHEIIVSDQVSVDNGNSWIKLYQHDEFDRRTRSENKLPHAIKESFFIPKEGHVDEVEEVLTGLVFEAKKDQNEAQVSSFAGGQFNKKLWISLGASVIVIAFFAMPKGQKSEVAEAEKNKTEKVAKARNITSPQNSEPQIIERRPASAEQKMYPKSKPSAFARKFVDRRRVEHQDEIVETDPKDEYGYQDPAQENYANEGQEQPPEQREIAGEPASEPQMENEVQEIKEEMMEEIQEMQAEPPVEEVSNF